MKTKILIGIFLLVISNNAFANTYIEKNILGHKVKVVKYNISGDDYKLKIVKSDNAKSLNDILVENNGITGVNGVFFCPADYGDCKGKEDTTNNERYFDGVKYNVWEDTGNRVVFGLDKQNKPLLFQTNKINPEKESEIWNGFSNWPLLLKDGKNQLEYYWDVNMVDPKMRKVMDRNFICNDKEKQNIFFGYVSNAYMDDMPTILSMIGCYDALNLDAGGSSAMVYNGKYLVGPGRKIIDSVVIEKKGLNVKRIQNNAKNISKNLIKKYDKLDTEQKINNLKKNLETLNKAKYEIYEKYSKDIIEVIDGQEKVVGYETNIYDINSLQKVYLLNNVITELNIYIKGLK